ncbi:hypothetical protein OAF98_04295 [Planctomicrobium sp.]|nr:hypothetical protein [Planctomicrobium sp.]MDB4743685.1 hypothetical protein [Planctomicrobium sp.]
MLQNLFHDESGFVISTELILVSTILVVGIIVGQTTLRDQVVTEFADTADAVSALDQSYLYSEIVVATHGSVAGTTFSDAADFCDANDDGVQGLDASGTCVLVDTGTAGFGAGVTSAEADLTSN